MNNYFDIVLLVIMVPTLLIMFFYEYPSKWGERKFIFGVRNREEFREEKASSAIGRIVSSTRKQALILMICSFVIMGLLMLIPDETVSMTIWVFFIIADLFLLSIPFMRANREMKSLKREIGIKSSSGTVYTDLKGAGAVHALKPVSIIIPNLITALCFLVSLLYDTGMLSLPASGRGGSFIMTSMTGTFLFVGLMLIPVAFMMDRIRNEVISSDSDTNRNYNRAKKKVFADMFIFMAWANAAVVILYSVMMFFINSDLVLIIQMTVYMLLLMAAIAILAKKSLAIDRRYRKETDIDVDDDDRWILGSFYYNPDDRRLNVAKRMGIGGTINLGHPAGKAIMIVSVLFIAAALVLMAFVSVLGKTNMKVSVENDTLICNMVFDYYKVPLSDISGAEYGAIEKGFSMSRQVGIGMDPVFIGTFIVNGESGCKVFMNVDADSYISFEAGGDTYYISCDTMQETEELFSKISAG